MPHRPTDPDTYDQIPDDPDLIIEWVIQLTDYLAGEYGTEWFADVTSIFVPILKVLRIQTQQIKELTDQIITLRSTGYAQGPDTPDENP